MGSSTWDESLFWFYTESGGELGQRGAALEPSIRADRDPGPTDRQVEAATRYRRIADVLHSLPKATQHTLRLAHTPLPPALRPAFAKLPELGSLIDDVFGRDRVLRAMARKGEDGRKALADMVGAARDLAATALRQYRAAAKDVRRARVAATRERQDARIAALLGPPPLAPLTESDLRAMGVL